MSEISGVREESKIDRFEVQDDLPKQEIPAPIHERISVPGESEGRMKTEEAMQRMVAPNLRALDRELKIRAQLEVVTSPVIKFSLLKELFKIKVEEFKQSGESIEEFAKEVRAYMDQKEKNLDALCSGPQGGLKRELHQLYSQMFVLAHEMKNFAILVPYKSLLLELYELELETGYKMGKTQLLMSEILAHVEVLKKLVDRLLIFRGLGTLQMMPSESTQQFFWNVMVPDTHKILGYLQDEDKELLKKVTLIITAVFFTNKIACLFSCSTADKDLLALFFPYIVKYASLDEVKEYFEARYKNLSDAERTYLWIDLHCQAVELLAPIDGEKSAQYLKKAKEIKEKNLWAYPFSFYRAGIEAKAKEADARIEETTRKVS